MSKEGSLLWNKLLLLAESMEDSSNSIEHIRCLLSGIEEGFADSFDPSDSYAEFVSVKLCRSMEAMLRQIEGQ